MDRTGYLPGKNRVTSATNQENLSVENRVNRVEPGNCRKYPRMGVGAPASAPACAPGPLSAVTRFHPVTRQRNSLLQELSSRYHIRCRILWGRKSRCRNHVLADEFSSKGNRRLGITFSEMRFRDGEIVVWESRFHRRILHDTEKLV